jgi:hypothetical protein
MLPVVALGLASGVLSAGGGIFSKIKHDEYADYLRSMNLQVPDSVYSAENIYRDMASKGLPGKDTIEADIQSQMARTMGLGKEVVDNPSALLDLLAKSSEGATANLRQLGVQDASAQMQNEAMLANFLSSVKAPTELNVNQFNMQKDIAAKSEEMAGYKELLNGLSSGLSSAMTGVGYGNMQKYMKGKNDLLDEHFDNIGKDGGTTEPVSDIFKQTISTPTISQESFDVGYGKYLTEQKNKQSTPESFEMMLKKYLSGIK